MKSVLMVLVLLVVTASFAMAQLSPGQVYGQANNSQLHQLQQQRLQAQQDHQRNMMQAQQELQRKLQDINFQRQQLGMNPTIAPQQKQQQFQALNQRQMEAQQRFQQSAQRYNMELQQKLNPNYQPGLGGSVKRFFGGR